MPSVKNDHAASEFKAALRWPPGSGKSRHLAVIMLTFFAGYALVFGVVTAQRLADSVTCPLLALAP